MSFTNVFGGQTIGPAFRSYNVIAVDASHGSILNALQLSWPTDFQTGNNVTANIMDISPATTGLYVKLPDATHQSVGQSFLITNPTAFSFNLIDFSGNLVAAISGPSSTFFYLINNSTPTGAWRNNPWGSGYVAVTSVDASSTNPNITVTGGPITTTGTFQFGVGADLNSTNGLTSFGLGGAGYAVRTAANTWALRQTQGTAGKIVVTNGAGILGNTIIDLSQNISGLQSIQVGNLSLCNQFGTAANTISAVNANGNITFTPNGTGAVTSNANVQISNGKALVLQNNAGNQSLSLNADTLTSSYSITLPQSAPGGAGYILESTGASTTGWLSSTDLVGSTKVRVIFEGPTGVIKHQLGIMSVNRVGAGDYIINFQTAFPDVYYSWVGGLSGSGIITFSAMSTSALRVNTYQVDGTTAQDVALISVWVSSDQ